MDTPHIRKFGDASFDSMEQEEKALCALVSAELDLPDEARDKSVDEFAAEFLQQVDPGRMRER